MEDVGCTVEGEGLVLSAFKPAEDGQGAVVRCVNMRGASVRGRLRFARRLSRAVEVRADESPIGELTLEESGSTVVFAVSGHGMISVLIECAD